MLFGWTIVILIFFTLFLGAREDSIYLPFRDGPKHSSSQWGILESRWDNFLENFAFIKEPLKVAPLFTLNLNVMSATAADTHLIWWQANGKPRESQRSLTSKGSCTVNLKNPLLRYWLTGFILLGNLWAFTKARLCISRYGCKDV